MGNDFQIATERSRANATTGDKQSNPVDVSAPGKQTLTSGLPPTSLDADSLLRSLKTRTIKDKAGYVFVITDEPAFELVHAPNGKGEGTMFRRTSPAWPTLVGLALQLQPVLKPGPGALAPTAPAPKPIAPAPAPAASKSIAAWIDDAIDELRDDATAVWHRAKALVSPSIAAPVAPVVASKPSSALPSKAEAVKAIAGHPAVEKITAVAAPAEIAANVALYQTKSPTIAGDTLAIATTRAGADYGVAGTEYTRQYSRDDKKRIAEIDKLLADDTAARKAKQTENLLSDVDKKKLKQERAAIDHKLATQIGSGNVDQSVFYCSGLSMWTLAAAGYNLDAQICGPDDHKPYYAEKTVDGKTDPEKVYASLRGVLDGYAADVEVMTLANGRRTGGSVGEFTGTGYLTTDKLTLAAGGAAGAFALAGIGEAVDDDKQKPGDFVQSRRSNDKDAKGNAVARQHRGFGHAWQVSAVTAKGSAWFGVAGRSPTVTGKTLTGWHEVPEMIIDATTDPLLVGEHTVIKSRRLEAQDASVVADQAHDTNKDGGVQITDWKPIGWHPSSYTDYVTFCGRLGTSKWAGFHAATADSARASASGESAPAEKSAPPTTGPGDFDVSDEQSV